MSQTSALRARVSSLQDTQDLAASMAELARPCDLLLLLGDLGVGKTAFAQGFGIGLGVSEKITSPTFALVQSYSGRMKLHHLDVYRLGHASEAFDLGLEELLDDNAVTLVEWGDTIRAALPGDYLEVRIIPEDEDDERTIELAAVGRGWIARMRAISVALARWGAEPC